MHMFRMCQNKDTDISEGMFQELFILFAEVFNLHIMQVFLAHLKWKFKWAVRTEPYPLQRGVNHKNAKIWWCYLKIPGVFWRINWPENLQNEYLKAFWHSGVSSSLNLRGWFGYNISSPWTKRFTSWCTRTNS
jgi:hypothetical protein